MNNSLSKRGYEDEYWARVSGTTNSGLARLVGVSDAIADERFVTGPLTCSTDARVPILLIPDVERPSAGTPVICTEPSIWGDKYAARLYKISVPSKEEIEKMRVAFEDSQPVRRILPLPSIETGRTIVEGELIRYSNKDNAVISIFDSEYTLRDETHKDVGDTLVVEIVNACMVVKASPERYEGQIVKQPPEATAKSDSGEHGDGECQTSTDNSGQDGTSGEEPIGGDTTSTSTAGDTGDIETEGASYTQVQRRTRDQKFADTVKSAYDNQCAICGVSRETPDGNPEVEAAHIHPKGKDGVDTVQNGIALCKLHHWAFDNGWFGITDEYNIIVKDAPDYTGYDEFARYEGNKLHLPDDEDQYPDPKYIRKHRRIHRLD